MRSKTPRRVLLAVLVATAASALVLAVLAGTADRAAARSLPATDLDIGIVAPQALAVIVAVLALIALVARRRRASAAVAGDPSTRGAAGSPIATAAASWSVRATNVADDAASFTLPPGSTRAAPPAQSEVMTDPATAPSGASEQPVDDAGISPAIDSSADDDDPTDDLAQGRVDDSYDAAVDDECDEHGDDVADDLDREQQTTSL